MLCSFPALELSRSYGMALGYIEKYVFWVCVFM